MENSNEIALKRITRFYTNMHSLMVGYEEAIKTNNLKSIEVELMDENGNMETVTLNSIQSVISSIERIDNNFQTLINTDNISYIVNGDGSLSQITKTTFMNNEYLQSFKIDDTCIIDDTNFIKQLIFPNVKLPITIDSEIKTPIIAKIYEVFDGFDEIKESPEIVDIEYLIDQGIISVTEISETKLELEKEKVTVFGKFAVISAETIGDVTTVVLDKSTYRTINSQADNMDLSIGDLLSATDGNTLYEITEIHNFSSRLVLKRIKGINNVQPGIDKLRLNAKLSTDTNIVGIPIQPQKKLVVFLSTENLKSISFPSVGIKIDTSIYKVTQDNQTYTLDEYFNKYVTNVSDYLVSMIKESSIPISLGVRPNTPELLIQNFKVTQINKHLTDAKSTKKLNELNAQKEKLKSEKEYKQNKIAVIQNDIDTRKYKSLNEKIKKQEEITNLKIEVNTTDTALLAVTRDLNNNAVQYGLKNSKPKYRVIGFWDIQNPMFSPSTAPQHIIKYEVQYRYLSINVDTVDTISYKMINNEGKEVNVTISPWNNYESEALTKLMADDGTLSWENTNPDSTELININQLNVAINENESIEIRIRAISEAGYPLSPLKSSWSNIIRVNFPEGLIENSINSVINRNDTDLRKQEFNDILAKSGILKHISGEVTEADKTFFHKAEDIASGFYTPEMKNIDLFQYLLNLRTDIDGILNTNITDQITIEVVDFNDEPIIVTNNSTIELTAGNYSDEINLLDVTKFGEIITKKGFIRISNRNNEPIEIKTLVPGPTITSANAGKYYNVPVRMPEGLLQKSKQIIYFRNNDITGQDEDVFKLIKPHGPKTTTIINPSYIDTNATEDAKDTVYIDATGAVKLVKLHPNAGNDFVAFSKKHPLFNTEDLTKIKPEFKRIELMTSNLKAPKFQEEPFIGSTPTSLLGFDPNDKFAIGANTTGAYLYPSINNINTVSVVGNTSTATLTVMEKSEIIIPFVFEFRMTDAKGEINGNKDLTINDDVVYNKTMGVDLLIGLTNFRFDINVTAKLKASVQNIESLNVSSVVGSFNNEGKENLL